MKFKNKILGLLVVGSLVLGTTGALVVDSFAQNRTNDFTNFSAKKQVAVKTNLTLENAKQIALKDAKSGKVSRAELDRENGIWVFEVEIVDGNIEKDYRIDANSGKILDIEIEADRNLYTPKVSQSATSSNTHSVTEAKISMEKAKEIALTAAKTGRVTKVELDRDYGMLVYEVEVKDAHIEKEYKINALTGEIVRNKVEMDDDQYDDDRFDFDDDDQYDDDRFDFDDDDQYDDDRFDFDDDDQYDDDDRFND